MSCTTVALLFDPADPAQSASAADLQSAATLVGGLVLNPVTNVNDLIGIDADLLVSLDRRRPKLCPLPSYLYLDATPAGADYGPAAFAAILSYDAYLAGDDDVASFLDDLRVGARKLDSPTLVFHPAASIPPLPQHMPDRVGNVAIGLDHETRPAMRAAAVRILVAGSMPIVPAGSGLELIFDGLLPLFDLDAPAALIARDMARHDEARAADPVAWYARYASAYEHAHRHLSGEHALHQLLSFHETVRAAKFDRRVTADPLPRVAYVVRAGGRPARFVERALKSLERQSGASVTAIIVLWQEVPGLRELLATLHLDCRVVELPGADRSMTLWRGLDEVARGGFDYFGLLDDDDELMGNHVARCLATLTYHRRLAIDPKPRAVWSGAIEVTELQRFEHTAESPELQVGPEDRVRLRCFTFNATRRAATWNNHVPPHAWLAAAELLDPEVLVCPRLDLAEDAFLLRQLNERTAFAATAEVTVISHHHAMDQSRYWDHRRRLRAFDRFNLRFLAHEFPVSAAFGERDIPQAWQPLCVPVQPLLGHADANRVLTEMLAETLVATSDGHGWEVVVDQLPGGKATLRWDLDFAGPPSAADDLALSVIGPSGTPLDGVTVTHIENTTQHSYRRADFDLAIRPDAAGQPVRLILSSAKVALRSTDSACLLRTYVEGIDVPWGEIPQDGALWIYGSGDGGRMTATRLAGRAIDGFLDSYRSGNLLGRPVVRLSEIADEVLAGSTIVIGSQFWAAILESLRDRRTGRIFVAYPFLPDSLSFVR